MKKAASGVLAVVLGLPLWASAQSVYLDPSQPIDKRVDDLIHQLTPAEKTSLLSTTAPAIDRLKVPVMNGWNQSLHGIVWTQPTTMFPVPISMAATWDPPLVHEVAGAIADEGRAVYNYWHTVQGTTETIRGQQVTVTAGRKKNCAQRAGVSLACDQYGPRSTLGKDLGDIRRGSAARVANHRRLCARNAGQ